MVLEMWGKPSTCGSVEGQGIILGCLVSLLLFTIVVHAIFFKLHNIAIGQELEG
mgnify:FL=1